ncbi:ABC transporter permease [Proteiniclasticum sp.]|uniref:ABC transporter permease n=1 Tax=Proteiniclasticum sp. TaxID=2053595 RepID=UPI002897E952|nr:ABC transporter permease [Proteiniclasticum sp.]
MKNLSTVYQFELKGLLKKKAYIVTTVVICAIIIIATTLPTILKMINGEEVAAEEPGAVSGNFGMFLETDDIDQALLEEKLAGIKLTYFDTSEELKDAVIEETVSTGYILKSETEYTVVVNNVGMYSGGDVMMDTALRAYAEDKALLEEGYDVDGIRNIMGSIAITGETEVLGKDSQNQYWIVYMLIMVTFMIIMFYGNNVATYVAREKSDRTMEILITSSDTNSLIIGKVLASGTAGILQAAAMGVTLFLGYRLNSGSYSEEILQFLNLRIDPDLLAVYILFALTGYFLLLFIYAGIGALMSKVEDVPSATTLVTMFVMVAYFISMFSLNLPESLLLKITSFVPFTSFMVMFVRYAVSSVTIMELVISYGILLVTAVLIALASVKIYRFGTLNYGNNSNVIKLVKKALKEDSDR